MTNQNQNRQQDKYQGQDKSRNKNPGQAGGDRTGSNRSESPNRNTQKDERQR